MLFISILQYLYHNLAFCFAMKSFCQKKKKSAPNKYNIPTRLHWVIDFTMVLAWTCQRDETISASFHWIFNHRLRPVSCWSYRIWPRSRPPPILLLTSMQMKPIGCLSTVLLWESRIDSYSNCVGFHLRIYDRILLEAPAGLPPAFCLFTSCFCWAWVSKYLYLSVIFNTMCG